MLSREPLFLVMVIAWASSPEVNFMAFSDDISSLLREFARSVVCLWIELHEDADLSAVGRLVFWWVIFSLILANLCNVFLYFIIVSEEEKGVRRFLWYILLTYWLSLKFIWNPLSSLGFLDWLTTFLTAICNVGCLGQDSRVPNTCEVIEVK